MVRRREVVMRTRLRALVTYLGWCTILRNVTEDLRVLGANYRYFRTILVENDNDGRVIRATRLRLRVIRELRFLTICNRSLVALRRSRFTNEQVLRRAICLRQSVRLGRSEALLSRTRRVRVTERVRTRQLTTAGSVRANNYERVTVRVTVVNLRLTLINAGRSVIVLRTRDLNLYVRLRSLNRILNDRVIIAPVRGGRKVSGRHRRGISRRAACRSRRSLPYQFTSRLM